jgi:serine/threonine-protein kinase
MTTDPRIGTELHGCLLEAEIGRGGMGVVYRAHQRGLERRVALKVITPELARDAGFRRRFERESRVAAAIDHPHVVPLYEAGEEEGRLFMLMRYIEGTDLGEVIAAEGALDPARAARVLQQVGSALDAAHRHGLVHRDVKPANVLLGGEGVDEHAYLSDFGLTKDAASQSALTHTGQWVGTADYVAPEQLEGQRIDARTDVYALGCLLYQVLTGSVPYPGAELAKMWGHVNSAPPAPSTVRPDLAVFDAVVARALAKDPADRFPSAGDLGRAVAAAARGERVAERERSVATGAAAPVPAGGAAGVAQPLADSAGATRLDRAAPASSPPPLREHREPATAPLPTARSRPGMAIAIVLATALAAIAGVAVALIVSREDPVAVENSGDEREPRRERPARTATTPATVTETTPAPATPAAPDSSSEASMQFSTPRDPGQTYAATYCRTGESSLYCWTPNDGYTLITPSDGPASRSRSDEAGNKGAAPSSYSELAFGDSSSARGFNCTSRSAGLTCTNSAGYGWRLPRYKGLPSFFSP